MTELAKANNVVEFPREQVVRRPPPEELQENLSEKKRQFCDEVVDNFSHQVYRKIRLHGFACENKEFIAQFSYVMESLDLVCIILSAKNIHLLRISKILLNNLRKKLMRFSFQTMTPI